MNLLPLSYSRPKPIHRPVDPLPPKDAHVRILSILDTQEDPEDMIALAYLIHNLAAQLVGIATTSYSLLQTASLAQFVCQQLRASSPIASGSGLPLDENSSSAPVNLMIELAKQHSSDLVIAVLGPLSDLATAMEEDFETLKTVRKIVLAGNWILDDLRASVKILSQREIPVLIVGSDFTLKNEVFITEQERLIFLASDPKTPLGQTLQQYMSIYWDHQSSSNNLSLEDSLTAYLSFHSECIEEEQPVQFSFQRNLFDFSIYDSAINRAIVITPVPESNIHIATKIKNPKSIKDQLLTTIGKLFYPNLSAKDFLEVLHGDDEPSMTVQILESLNELHSWQPGK